MPRCWKAFRAGKKILLFWFQWQHSNYVEANGIFEPAQIVGLLRMSSSPVVGELAFLYEHKLADNKVILWRTVNELIIADKNQVRDLIRLAVNISGELNDYRMMIQSLYFFWRPNQPLVSSSWREIELTPKFNQ